MGLFPSIYGNLKKIGVDDSITECDLDDKKDWDFTVNNNSDEESTLSLEQVIEYAKKIFPL
jgi:hypothetical protein